MRKTTAGPTTAKVKPYVPKSWRVAAKAIGIPLAEYVRHRLQGDTWAKKHGWQTREERMALQPAREKRAEVFYREHAGLPTRRASRRISKPSPEEL